MNYNDQILENKAFNFFKQLMYNLALSICILLVGVLVAVYVFGFKLYKVQSGSEAPYLFENDIAIVKAQKEYKVGDIIKFDDASGTPVAHRLIWIYTESGKTYYICHGDAVDNMDGTENKDSAWEDDVEFVRKEIEENGAKLKDMKNWNAQFPTLEKIEGKVVSSLRKYGTYVEFIKEHYMLFISLVAGIWCISSVVQNEIEMKKARRLV